MASKVNSRIETILIVQKLLQKRISQKTWLYGLLTCLLHLPFTIMSILYLLIFREHIPLDIYVPGILILASTANIMVFSGRYYHNAIVCASNVRIFPISDVELYRLHLATYVVDLNFYSSVLHSVLIGYIVLASISNLSPVDCILVMTFLGLLSLSLEIWKANFYLYSYKYRGKIKNLILVSYLIPFIMFQIFAMTGGESTHLFSIPLIGWTASGLIAVSNANFFDTALFFLVMLISTLSGPVLGVRYVSRMI